MATASFPAAHPGVKNVGRVILQGRISQRDLDHLLVKSI